MTRLAATWERWYAVRSRTAHWWDDWPLPTINPDSISVLSVLVIGLVLAAMSVGMPLVAWIFLCVHLLLDGLDGAVARSVWPRRKHAAAAHGRAVDLIADRVSELILFLWPAFFAPWWYLALVNIPLAILKYRTPILPVLPLRQLFLIFFLFQLLAA